MKITIDVLGEEAEKVVVASLKQSYEECMKTMLSPSRLMYDPIEDVLRRQAALAEVLAYYMESNEFKNFMHIWNHRLMENTKEE